MKRINMRLFMCTAALLWSSANAQLSATTSVEVEILAKAAQSQPQKAPKKHPIKTPRKPPNIGPGTGTTKDPLTQKQRQAMDTYNECMAAGERDGIEEVVRRAQAAYGKKGPYGSPEKHGHETCIIDAFGIKRYQKVSDIPPAVPTELISMKDHYRPTCEPQNIASGAQPPVVVFCVTEKDIPFERQFIRSWVIEYWQERAQKIEEFLRTKKSRLSPRYLKKEIVLRISSGLRPIDVQQAIVERTDKDLNANGSFADCRLKELCSTHTSGSTFDLSLIDMDPNVRFWLMRQLEEDRKAGAAFGIIEGASDRSGNRYFGHLHILVVPPLDYPGDKRNGDKKDKMDAPSEEEKKAAEPATER
jgi:hypothetical protein